MTARILIGDCRDHLATFEPDSIDACVTDPPYGLTDIGRKFQGQGGTLRPDGGKRSESRGSGFMGQAWDGTGVELDPDTWAAVYRVLKPGAHLLAFGGTRTVHRIACAIEDAGFEIRDQIAWLYGSGFPKSLNVSKAMDKAAGAEREVVGERVRLGDKTSYVSNDIRGGAYGNGHRSDLPDAVTAPSTDLARQWDGWGSALKPAMEPIIVARKPLIDTIAANVALHGTGAINIDGCRIGTTADKLVRPSVPRFDNAVYGAGLGAGVQNEPVGRWPANVVLDEAAGAVLDEMTGDRPSGGGDKHGRKPSTFCVSTDWAKFKDTSVGGDTGGASRFFYCAKASRSERGPTNTHPTVKPVSLMRWLVRLVTPPGGIVLDPFMGSGTTGIACSREGFLFVGIELSSEYAEIARRRIHGDAPLFANVI